MKFSCKWTIKVSDKYLYEEFVYFSSRKYFLWNNNNKENAAKEKILRKRKKKIRLRLKHIQKRNEN